MTDPVHVDSDSPGFTAIPELENRPRSDFERSVMNELACTCGDCKLELITTCRCSFAAKMRGEVIAQLDELDLSTDAARTAAAGAVQTSFVARYGSRALDRTNRLDPSGRWAMFAIVAAAILALLTAVALRRRRILRDHGRALHDRPRAPIEGDRRD